MTMLPADCSVVSPGLGATPSGLEKFLRVLSVVTMLMTVPQVWAVWSSTKAVGVSPLSWGTYLFSACLWFIYGIQKRDKTIYLACIGWIASIYYRQYRTTLYSLGDGRRAVLYGALAVATLTLTGTSRLWNTSAGSVAWLLLMGACVYAVFAVVWSARKY